MELPSPTHQLPEAPPPEKLPPPPEKLLPEELPRHEPPLLQAPPRELRQIPPLPGLPLHFFPHFCNCALPAVLKDSQSL